MLALPEMRPLNQRIARRRVIRPLTCDEVEKFVAFRVRMAGGAWETLFTGRALDLIHEFSGGASQDQPHLRPITRGRVRRPESDDQ